jgi:hypothetical protein
MSNDIIKDVHASDIYGVFIETGPFVAPTLLNVSGASKTIYFSECPYSKQYAETKYGINLDKIRAVSYEYVNAIIDYYAELIDNNTINTIFVVSLQVGDIDQTTITHGWIGLRYKDVTTMYHITIRDKLCARHKYIDKIKTIGITLLSLKNIPLDHHKNMYIDNIVSKGEYDVFNYMDPNDVISINTSNEIVRLEDIFRDKDNIIIYPVSIIADYQLQTIKEVNLNESTVCTFILSSKSAESIIINNDNIKNIISIATTNGINCIVTFDVWNNDKINKFFNNNFEKSHIKIIT